MSQTPLDMGAWQIIARRTKEIKSTSVKVHLYQNLAESLKPISGQEREREAQPAMGGLPWECSEPRSCVGMRDHTLSPDKAFQVKSKRFLCFVLSGRDRHLRTHVECLQVIH